jgi:hypothetical protein
MIEMIFLFGLVFAGGFGIGKAFDANRARSLEAAKASAEFREALKKEEGRGR